MGSLNLLSPASSVSEPKLSKTLRGAKRAGGRRPSASSGAPRILSLDNAAEHLSSDGASKGETTHAAVAGRVVGCVRRVLSEEAGFWKASN